jgi:hypothetical protein
MNINWHFSPPRTGLAGAWDRFVGPGATRAEVALQLAVPLLAALAAPWHAARSGADWSTGQAVLGTLLAADIAGGIVTNATSTAKRWYHRAGHGVRQHLLFVLLHGVHLLLVSWAFLQMDWIWVLQTGGFLMAAAAAILLVPRYLQRPVALTAYAASVWLALDVFRRPPGLEWFLILFYLKLLVSHLPREEPYRPAREAPP